MDNFASLLDYLASESAKQQKQKLLKSVHKQSQEVRKIRDETKKLLDTSQFISDLPSFDEKRPTSKGFNVKHFESLMRAKLLEDYKTRLSYKQDYISVSDLLECPRNVYYRRVKTQVDSSKLFKFPYLYLIQEVGKTIHKIIQSLYNFEELEKTVISEKFKTKGRVDGIRDKFLFEIKSFDDEKFKNTYQKDHYHQGVIYAHILNSEYDYKIETITIIYVLRGLKSIIPFDVPINGELAEKFLSSAPILFNAIEKHQIPKPTEEKKLCKFCIYSDICQKDDLNSKFDKKNGKTAFLL